MELSNIGTIEADKTQKKEWKLIPDGEYAATLTFVEQKDSKSGNPMLMAKFVVDVHGNEMVHNQRFMLGGTTEKALAFHQMKMKRMAKVLGFHEELQSTEQLISLVGKKCKVKIIRKDSANPAYGPSNDVKDFKTL